jgi:steroid delta-isomerase-like uncharacterized protein
VRKQTGKGGNKMATDAEKKIKDELAAVNSHDVNKILPFFTDDCVYEDVALGLVSRGKKELNGFFNTVFVDLPDFKLEVKSVFGASDWVGFEWVMTGTFAHSSIPGMPATGKKFSVRGASIRELRNGKVSRNSDYWNLASFMQQVGLMPGPSK